MHIPSRFIFKFKFSESSLNSSLPWESLSFYHDTKKEAVQDSLLNHIISFTYSPPSFPFLHGYARPSESLCKTSHQSLPLSNPNFLNPTISPTFTPAKLTTFPSFNFKPILLTHLFMTAMSVWHYATYNNLQEI